MSKIHNISGRTDGSVRNLKQPIVDNHGHSFTKKNFNCPRPVYCHICLDLLNWSLFNTGLNCEGLSNTEQQANQLSYATRISTNYKMTYFF